MKPIAIVLLLSGCGAAVYPQRQEVSDTVLVCKDTICERVDRAAIRRVLNDMALPPPTPQAN